MLDRYQKPRTRRRVFRSPTGKLQAGKLMPVLFEQLLPSESGVLDQSITLELDPIAGQMITPITATVTTVYAPAAAMIALANPDDDFVGTDAYMRDLMQSGNPIFPLENDHLIARLLKIEPSSVGGVKKVASSVRLGHNAAVNYLRQRKYHKATLLDGSSLSVTPALLGQTVLDRLNGVLDPDNRINGAVDLNIPDISIPVKGIGKDYDVSSSGITHTGKGAYENTGSLDDSTGLPVTYPNAVNIDQADSNLFVRLSDTGIPQIYANLEGVSAGQMSLHDFYDAERIDAHTRFFSELVKKYPTKAEAAISAFAHGLDVDLSGDPFVIYERDHVFGQSLKTALDGSGIQSDIMRSDHIVQANFTVPVPRSQFGGAIITFVSIKPDETMPRQPDPILSQPIGAINYVRDEGLIDPVAVTMRDLDSDIPQANESDVALWVGNHGLKRFYQTYGFNREIDQTTVAAKTALWQIEVPMSVTPDTITYPEDYPTDLDKFPFAMNAATDSVCTYTARSLAVINTPLIFGPTPIESNQHIEDADIFGEGEVIE